MTKTPESDDSLWDPVARGAEERAELPVARVVKMDVPPPKAEEPTMPVAELVPALLAQLEGGSINAAVAIEDDWRESGGRDDLGGASELVRTQWPLVKELMGVATDLPVPVVTAFASAINAGDPALARPALQAFRQSDANGANAANGLLAGRARALHQATSSALYTAPPARPEYYANYTPPSISRSSGGMSGWRMVSLGAVVVSALVRFAATSHTSSYDYDYHPIDIPKFDPSLYNVPTYDPSTYNTYNSYTPPTTPSAPSPFQADAERAVLLDELIVETQSLETYGLVPLEHEAKVDTFLADALDDACARMRVSFVKVEKLKPIDDAEKASAAKEQLTAIRQRLDVVCPKKKSKAQSPNGSSK